MDVERVIDRTEKWSVGSNDDDINSCFNIVDFVMLKAVYFVVFSFLPFSALLRRSFFRQWDIPLT